MVLVDPSLALDGESRSPVLSAGSAASAAVVFVPAVRINVGGALEQQGQDRTCTATRCADGSRRTSGNRDGRSRGVPSAKRNNCRWATNRRARRRQAAPRTTPRTAATSSSSGGTDGSTAATTARAAEAAAALIQRCFRRRLARVAAAARAERAAAAERGLRWAQRLRLQRGAAAAAVEAAGRIQAAFRGWHQRARTQRTTARQAAEFPQPASAEGAWTPTSEPAPDAAERASQVDAPVRNGPVAEVAEECMPPGARVAEGLGAYNGGRCMTEAPRTADDRATSGTAPAGRRRQGSSAAMRARPAPTARREPGLAAVARVAPATASPGACGEPWRVVRRERRAGAGAGVPPPPLLTEAPPAPAVEAERAAAPSERRRVEEAEARVEAAPQPPPPPPRAAHPLPHAGTRAPTTRAESGATPGESRGGAAERPAVASEDAAPGAPKPAAQQGAGRARRGGGGPGPLAALWALLTLASTVGAEDAAQMLEHADALCARVGADRAASLTANAAADREVQRVRAELLRRTRGSGGAAEVGELPGAASPVAGIGSRGAAQPATPRAAAAAAAAGLDEFAREVARAEAAGGAATARGVCCRCEASLPLAVGFSKKQRPRVARAMGKCKRCVAATCGWHEPAPSAGGEAGPKVWAARCADCRRELSSDEFSNNQRGRLKRGAAGRCKACVHAASPQGQAEAERAAAAEERAAAEAAEPAVEPDAVEAALTRWHWRRAARDAGRAAEAAAASAVAAVGDTTPVFLGEGGGEFRCLGAAWAAPFQDDLGRRFASAKHFLMHRKAATFGDEARCALILAGPARAVELGRLVEPFDETRWAEHREGWLEDGLWRSMRAHPDMAAALLGTGDRLLVEGSAASWGVGAGVADAELERRCAAGNRHGRALMRVRYRLRRAHAIARSSAALPWQCDPVNGGVDWELFADTLECYDAATCLRDREAVCSRTGARWSDVGFVDVLRRIPLDGGVSASAEAVAELDAGGVDRVAGRNGSMGLEEMMASFRLLQAELEAGHLELFLERAMMGSKPCWFHPISLVTKNKDGSPKFKAAVDYVLGAVRDGEYGGAPLFKKGTP